MKLSVYIAKRYLFAKKSRNAINIISGVSVAGVAVGTMTLIIVLSVFNGLEKLVSSIFNTFDPDIKITAAQGKTFTADAAMLTFLSNTDGILSYSITLEENALLRYDEKQYIATIKGVDDNYHQVTDINNAMREGEFTLKAENGRQFAVPGMGVSQYLGMRINFLTPLFVYVPRKTGEINLNAENAFNRDHVFLSGIYEVEKEYDSKYIYLPIDFVRDLTDNQNASSSIEIKVKKESETDAIKKKIAKELGNGYVVQNRYEQQEIFYKVMKSERLAIFVILTLILVIASFNMICSLTMLIIEKVRDNEILKSLCADNDLIRKIFIFEGWLISIIGAGAGIVLGFLVCWLQQTFGLVRLQSESLIMDAYPVVLKLKDFLVVPATVLLIGYWAAWYPVRYLTKKFLKKEI